MVKFISLRGYSFVSGLAGNVQSMKPVQFFNFNCTGFIFCTFCGSVTVYFIILNMLSTLKGFCKLLLNSKDRSDYAILNIVFIAKVLKRV